MNSMSQDVYPDKFDISQLIKQLIAQIVGLDEMHIDLNLPLSSFGLDSAAMMGVVIELEEKLGIRIDPDLMYEDLTIDKLASQLACMTQDKS